MLELKPVFKPILNSALKFNVANLFKPFIFTIGYVFSLFDTFCKTYLPSFVLLFHLDIFAPVSLNWDASNHAFTPFTGKPAIGASILGGGAK